MNNKSEDKTYQYNNFDKNHNWVSRTEYLEESKKFATTGKSIMLMERKIEYGE